MPKRRLIVHPVGGIGHHQARGGPGEEPGDIRRRRRVPAHEAVAAELEHVAAPDRGRGGRGQHGVLVGLRLRPLRGEEPGELLGRPEGLQSHARLFELPQHGRIPVQVEFGDPVVGQRQLPGPGIGPRVQIHPLHHNEFLAGGGHHRDREPQVLGLFHGLVPPQNAPPRVDHDGAARTVRVQTAPQGLAAPIRPAVGVEGIGLQVVERLNGWDLAHPHGGSFDRGHRVPPAGARAGILLLGHPAGWPLGARRVTSVYIFKQSGEA